MNKLCVVLTIVGFVFVGENRVAAAEAVGMEVLQDGEHIAGFTVTYTGETEADIWLMLRNTPLTFERDFVIPVDSSDNTKATLTGSIEVRTHRRGNPGSGAKTEKLRLVQRGSKDWFVAESDILRTLKAAGLAIPDKTSNPRANATAPKDDAPGIYFAVIVLLIGSIAVGAVLLLVRGHHERSAQP